METVISGGCKGIENALIHNIRSCRHCLCLNADMCTIYDMAMSKKLSEQEVRYVAKLSRLDLSDQQIQHFAGQMATVLDYISKLNELDVEGVEPMAHALDVTNVLRPDEPLSGMAVEQALANAPDRSPPFFKVPKVLGHDLGA